METRASHVMIGAFTLVIVAMAVMFVLWLGKLSLDREWTEYEIVFGEAITGLSLGGAVQYNGIQVGEVRKLFLDPNDPSLVIAHVRVHSETPIKTDTRAKLAITGLTGVSIIQLSGGSVGAENLATVAHTTAYPRIVADESALAKLLASSEDIVTSTNGIILRISNLLTEENMGKIEATLSHIETFTQALAHGDKDVSKMLADLSKSASALKTTLASAESLFERLDKSAEGLESLIDKDARRTLVDARKALQSVRQLTDAANVTLQKNQAALDTLGSQGLTQVGPAIAQIRSAMESLDRLMLDLERDPSVLIRGADQAREYKPQ